MRNESLYDRGYIVNYDDGDSSIHRTPLGYIVSTDDIFHVIKDGESLLEISQEYYGSQHLWYVLADVNMDIILDIFELTVGETIVIPNLDILDAVYG